MSGKGKADDYGRALQDATRSYLEGRPRVALAYVGAALAGDPRCYEALVMGAEIYAFCAADLGLEQEEGTRTALSLLERALAARPGDADAYAAKALVLLYSDRFEDALQSAEAGLARFHSARPLDEADEMIWANIGETLYRVRALALRYLDRLEEGRHALAEGLALFPESEYLTQAVDEFLIEDDDL